jgi:hypothetical protein
MPHSHISPSGGGGGLLFWLVCACLVLSLGIEELSGQDSLYD